MSDRTAAFVEWLTLFSRLVGLTGDRVDHSQLELKIWWKALGLKLHPDAIGNSTYAPRASQLCATINNLASEYFNSQNELSPPDPQDYPAFDGNSEHRADKVPAGRSSRTGRRVYLVTFSHPNAEHCKKPEEFTRQSFGDLLMKAFESIENLRVCYLAVFQEHHAITGHSTDHLHFHACVKSTRQHQWKHVAQFLREQAKV